MFGFYGTLAISFLLLFIQGINGQSSFTVAALMLPVIAIMYELHSNPYDALLGTNDARAMQDLVSYYYSKNKDFLFLSLYMREFDEEDKDLPEGIKALMRQFTYQFFKSARMFSLSKGHVVVICLKKPGVEYEENIKGILDAFFPLYEKFRYDYKIVIGESNEEVSRKSDYENYVKSIRRTMPECTVHRVNPNDIVTFRQTEYIFKELADIHRKQDLDDPRVLAYCQPVLNVQTGQYDTAEALMRLDLEETGIVYPVQFILFLN